MKLDQPVSVRFRNEESDFLRILWRMRRRALLISFVVVCLIFGSFIFYAANVTPADPSDDRRWIIYLASVIVPVIVAVGMFTALKSSAKKAAASADLVMMKFDEDGIEIDGPSSSSKSGWNAYEKVVDTPDDFVFYIQASIFFGVPKRFFSDSHEIQRVKELISEHSRK